MLRFALKTLKFTYYMSIDLIFGVVLTVDNLGLKYFVVMPVFF